MSYFWKTLWHIMGTKLIFSTAYNPQTDGQIEVVNRSLGNLLRCLIGENGRTWESILPVTQFAYNNSVNTSIGMSPFEIVHGYTPRRPLDLLPMSPHDRISVSAVEFASHMHELHKEINKRIHASNFKYKTQANLHRLHLHFDVGDYVMICIRPEWYPSGTVKKLQARSAGPFKVLKKLGPNAYVIDIPSNYGISSTFNIVDLIAFKGPAVIPYDPFDDPPSSSLANPVPSPTPSCFQKAHKDIFDVILD